MRDAKWKLNQAGQLCEMTQAPFVEPVVANGTANPKAKAARQRLQAALDKLNPAGGILDHGDGTGRHTSKAEKKAER